MEPCSPVSQRKPILLDKKIDEASVVVNVFDVATIKDCKSFYKVSLMRYIMYNKVFFFLLFNF